MAFSCSFNKVLLSLGLATLRFVCGSPIFPRQISTSELLPSYDYIIIGGGTAGLTVADRLTEDPNVQVLVLEAGGWGDQQDILEVYVPPDEYTGAGDLWTRSGWPNLPWVPQEKLGDSRVRSLAVGKVVGGSSAINGMYAMRGSAENYDHWSQLFGASAVQSGPADWSWNGILPYFQKGMKFNTPTPELTDNFPSLQFDESFWGRPADATTGVQVGWPTFYYPTVSYFFDAFRQIDGVQFPVDSGAGEPGFYWMPALVDQTKVQRSYARTGHYSNINATRSNYQLLINTLARRLVLDETNTVKAVEFLPDNGSPITVNAGEVVVSAGAIHTPHILQLSGIGPASLLQSAGIEVRVDLPGVGQNFHDHSGMIDMFIRLPGLSGIHPNGGDLNVENGTFRRLADELWAANRTGPYSIAAPNVAGWLPLTATMPGQFEALATKLEQQDLASFLRATHLGGEAHPTVVAGYESQMKLLAAAMRSSGTAWSRNQVNPGSGVQGPVLLQSFQRGTININTTDPWNTEPVIDYNALANPVELDVMVELLKFNRLLHFNTSLADFGPVEVRPGSNVTADDDLKAYIASKMNPSDLHPVGSCSMLPLELGGCVDQTLRVYGVKNLRVADASIMSMIPSANTCQPTYALAEKAADIIKSGI